MSMQMWGWRGQDCLLRLEIRESHETTYEVWIMYILASTRMYSLRQQNLHLACKKFMRTDRERKYSHNVRKLTYYYN